ncbi:MULTISPECIES: aldose epimerase family protein [unclassified Sphingomonas]|uniref:aldose epimerase family protein n=1 Tax=unclassified Sphingomonas TaxID=196159 RepID=UPI000E711029|nr:MULTISPECIES: aldose epimerase family protein [unclassified Sphingomonas]RKE53554.1 aldose 1-epimerase [Sphingomonas sp. PP-CC-1A-547]TCM10048.1 aldose 1-epimerase [Sphingomonas sp. PP-CC-3G-468]
MRAITKSGIIVATLLAALSAHAADAAEAKRAPAGTLKDGTAIEAVTLSNAHGVSARILSYGATLQSLMGPDRNGKIADVMLGYDDLASYVDHPNFFGVTVGRFANRIAGGRFTLDGKAYQLPLNDKVNSLHGGGKGFDKVAWKIVSATNGPTATLVLGYRSSDGDSGYPGNLDVTVTYTLDEAGNLGIAYDAKTDKPTIVNMTNHAIFDLGGEGSAMGAYGHRLTIPAKAITPVDDKLIPTGALQPVAGTVFDFRNGRIVGEGIRDGRDQQIRYGHGYDHNFALDKGLTAKPELAARLEDPVSGRVLEVLTTEPGVQFYTGNFLDGTFIGKKGHLYRMGDGIALEPQKFPDAPNKPNFVSARVDPGKPYHHAMIYRLSVAR